MNFHASEEIGFHGDVLNVSLLVLFFFEPLQALFQEKKIVQPQLLVEEQDIPTRVNRAVDMEDRVVLKSPNQIANDIHLLQLPQDRIVTRGLRSRSGRSRNSIWAGVC